MHSRSFLQSVLVGLCASTAVVRAHTWIEQLMVLSSEGTMVGDPGFPRGNLLRTNPGFNDPAMVHLIPANGGTINVIQPSDLMCKSSQTQQQQTDGSPRLKAAAGAAVALRFQENGHVTLPDNQPGKPPNRGTVYVYGTSNPSPDDSFLAIHRVWNAAGTGGDGRGRLLSTQNFDDGQCYQVNGGTISLQRQKTFPHQANSLMGNDLWCQQDIALPADAPAGKPYTLYWVWDWPTLPGTAGFPQGKQEIYTTCMDIDIVASSGTSAVSKAQGINFLKGQPLESAGIASELADITNPTAVIGQTIAFGATATGPASGAAKSASASSEDPAVFLSVHTKSTDGPGLETTIIPIGVSLSTAQATQSQTRGGGRGSSQAAFTQATNTQAISAQVTNTQAVNTQATSSQVVNTQVTNSQAGQPALPQTTQATGNGQQPQQTDNGNGRGRGGHSRGGDGNSQANAQTVGVADQPINSQAVATSQQTQNPAQSLQPAIQESVTAKSNSQAAAVTASAGQGGRGGNANTMVTVTEVDSVFETVFQTVYNTRFQKRYVSTKATDSASSLSPKKTAAASCSTTERVFRLRARNPFYPFRVTEEQAQSTGC